MLRCCSINQDNAFKMVMLWKKTIALMLAVGILCCGCSSKENSSSAATEIQSKTEPTILEESYSSASDLTEKRAQQILEIWASFGGNLPSFSDVNEWIHKYFGIHATFIENDDFNAARGYKYPFPLANASNDKTILEYDERENQITVKAQYDFILPPEFYEGGGKQSIICTVTASATNDNIHFISATQTPILYRPNVNDSCYHNQYV